MKHLDHPPRLNAVLSRVPPDEGARLRTVWDLVGADEPAPGPETGVEEALRRLEAELERRAATGSRAPSRGPVRHVRKRRLWTAALAIVAVGVVSLFGWAWLRERPVVHTAPLGERLVIELADGSRVELSSGASLGHDRRFGDERRVRLDGEAFFDVAHAGAAVPFVVETFNARIRVLGTRFNVRAWASDPAPATTVALVSGRVALAPAGAPERAATLVAGEIRRVAGGEGAAVQAAGLSVDEAMAWRRGDVVFGDQPLGAILADVERRFAVRLRVEPEAARQRHMGGTLRQPESAEVVVRALAFSLGLRYRETSDGYTLFEERP